MWELWDNLFDCGKPPPDNKTSVYMKEMLIRGEVKDGQLQMNSKWKAQRDHTFQVCHVLSDRKSFFLCVCVCVDVKHSCQCHPVLWYKNKSFSQEGNLTPRCKQNRSYNCWNVTNLTGASFRRPAERFMGLWFTTKHRCGNRESCSVTKTLPADL